MNSRERALAAMARYKMGHNTRVAAFPPFPPKGQAPPQFNGPDKRNIPNDHEFDPRALKPMSKALWAASVALGHALTSYRHLSRLKSTSVSPDGNLGGRGYILSVKEARQKLFEACEALSTISDTLHDEITAPHWQPKLAMLDENDAEDVSRFVEESQINLEDPEADAEKDIKEIEEANDGPKKSDEPGSKVPEGASSEAQEAEPAKPPMVKEAGLIGLYDEVPLSSLQLPLRERIALRFRRQSRFVTKDELAARGEKYLQEEYGGDIDALYRDHDIRNLLGGNSSLPVDSLPGPRVDHIGPAEGDGPYGSYNEDEFKVDDAWQRDDGGSGRRHDHGEDYDYPSEWENDLRQATLDQPDEEAAAWAKEALRVEATSLTKDEISVLKDIKQEERGGGILLRKLMGRDEVRVAERLVKKGLVHKGTSDDRQRTVGFSLTFEGENALDDALRTASSGMPDHNVDPTETEAWDAGLGFGAKGQGAGGYENPSGEGAGNKGVWGPQSGLPGNPGQSSGDTTPATERAIQDRQSQGLMPQDVAWPAARSDYYPGLKDNLVQGEHSEWGASALPEEGQAPVEVRVTELPDTHTTTEDTNTPYTRWDWTTKTERPDHQHGRPEEVPWAHDTNVPR